MRFLVERNVDQEVVYLGEAWSGNGDEEQECLEAA
jgi:hypothetical protein